MDKLVGSPDYVEHWTNRWADLLQVNRKFLGDEGDQAVPRLDPRMRSPTNMPYDKFCYDLLTGTGSNVANPPASYFKILRDPAGAMENTTHLFLGVRFNCNKCHDHPFERWTQNQYYETVVVLRAASASRRTRSSRAARRKGRRCAVRCRWSRSSRTATTARSRTPRTGQNAVAKFPFEYPAHAPGREDSRREQLAKWITSKDNPYFAKSYVNRVWSYLLGVGMIEPIDDIRAGNPPTNPQLLDELTEEFIKSDFNVQRADQDDLQVAHLSALDRDQRVEQGRRRQLLARPRPPAAGGGAVRFDLPGDRFAVAAAGLAGRGRWRLLDPSVKAPGGFFELFGRPPRESPASANAPAACSSARCSTC